MPQSYQFDPQQLPAEQGVAAEDQSPDSQTPWAWWQSAADHRFDDQGLGTVTLGGESYLTIIALTTGRLPKFVPYVEDEFFGLTPSSLEEEVAVGQNLAAHNWLALVTNAAVSLQESDEFAFTPPLSFGLIEEGYSSERQRSSVWSHDLTLRDTEQFVALVTTLGGDAGQFTVIVLSQNGRYSRVSSFAEDEYPAAIAIAGSDDLDFVGQKTDRNDRSERELYHSDEYPTPPTSFGLEDADFTGGQKTRIPWRMCVFLGGDIGVRVMPFDDEAYDTPRQTVVPRYTSFTAQDDEPMFVAPVQFGLFDEQVRSERQRSSWTAHVFQDDEIRVEPAGVSTLGGESGQYVTIVLSSSGRAVQRPNAPDGELPIYLPPPVIFDDDPAASVDRTRTHWRSIVFLGGDIGVRVMPFDDEVYESPRRVVDVRYASFTAQDDEPTFVAATPFGLFDESAPSLTTYVVRNVYRRDHLDDEISTYVSPPMFDDESDLVVSRTYVPRSSFVFLGDEVFVVAFDDDTYVSITPTAVVRHPAFKFEDDEHIFTPVVLIASDDWPSIFERTVHRSWITRSMDEDESIFAAFGLDDHVECSYGRQRIDWRSSFSFISPEELEFDRFDVPCVTLASDGFSLVLVSDGFSLVLVSDGFDAELSNVRCDC